MRRANAKATHDLDQGGVARYHQLSSLFRRRIESGDWPVGRQIPTLGALAAEFQVAPATVRRAVDSLVQEGVLACYRAKGTFVLKAPVESLWQEIETDSGGFLRTRGGARIELVADEIAQALPPSPIEEGRPAPAYRRLRRVYWRDNQAFALIDTYIDAAIAAEIPQDVLAGRANQELLAQVKGVVVTSLRQTLTIGAADPEASRILRVPLNAPVAKIDRRRLDPSGAVVLSSQGIYRGDVVRLDFHEDPSRRPGE